MVAWIPVLAYFPERFQFVSSDAFGSPFDGGRTMARRSKASLLKRQREQKKAEKAAHKREARAERDAAAPGSGAQVASEEDLAGYGLSNPGSGRAEGD